MKVDYTYDSISWTRSFQNSVVPSETCPACASQMSQIPVSTLYRSQSHPWLANDFSFHAIISVFFDVTPYCLSSNLDIAIV